MSARIQVLMALLLVLLITLTVLRLVREFHERPLDVTVYYCDHKGCS